MDRERERKNGEKDFLFSLKTRNVRVLPLALRRREPLFTSLRSTLFFPALATPRYTIACVIVAVVSVRRGTPLPARDNDIAGKEESVSARFTTPGGADVTGAKLIS